MAEKIKCSNCENEATVHLTQIVNNKIHKVDLCESCAQKKGVTDPHGFSLAELLTKNALHPVAPPNLVVCPQCGLNTGDFRRTGRLGCAACFSVFTSTLRPLLEDMHVGITHKGKVPEFSLNRQLHEAELDNLRDALSRAVESEAYEDAAKYRDRIKLIEAATQAEELSHS
ncbi:MAG: protein arginine kinase activator [Lentimonas sp.]|jgi:protein arginine kinase activator